MAATSFPSTTTPETTVPHVDYQTVLAPYPRLQNLKSPSWVVQVLGTMGRYDVRWVAITCIAVAAIGGVGMLFLAKFAGAKLIGAGLLAGATIGTAWQGYLSYARITGMKEDIRGLRAMPNELYWILENSPIKEINLDQLVLAIASNPECIHGTPYRTATPLEIAHKQLVTEERMTQLLNDPDCDNDKFGRIRKNLRNNHRIAIAILEKAEHDFAKPTTGE